MTDLLAGLNDEQLRAVTHPGGPLLVSAGPGSGKTRVITHRIAGRIVSGDIAPDRLLAITFTNRAAEEMKTRVQRLVGADNRLQIGTFHWASAAILRRYGHVGGLSRSFRLLSPAEARAVLRDVTTSLPAHQRARLPAAVSALKNGASLQTAARRHSLDPAALAEARRIYDRRLESMAALDLDDLLARTVSLLRDGESVLNRCRDAHDEILIDEYQDTNPVQQALVELLAPPSRTVVAVGDADQAIYGWRQAGTGAFQRFLGAFPDAEIIRLQRSYRSTKRIVRAASALIAHNPDRLAGDLQTSNPAGDKPVCFVADDERDEAEWVAAEVAKLADVGMQLDQVAVMYRVNAQSRAIEDALIRRSIPYKVLGASPFYVRPEVQQVIACLRLAAGNDDHGAGLLARSVPGIGERRLRALEERARQEGVPLHEVFVHGVPGITSAALAALQQIAAGVVTLRARRVGRLLGLVDTGIALVSSFHRHRPAVEQEAVAENLAEFRSLVVEMGPRSTLPTLLDHLSLGGNEGAGTGISLMTLHASKGLEFRAVFMAGLEEGLLPHRRSLEHEGEIQEERRLCYVGMTRARERLYLSYAHSRLFGGAPSLGQPSRFITEIGPGLLAVEMSTRRRARPRLSSVQLGDRVAHPRWREGVVTLVEGSGRETLVTVRFAGGEKRLQLCHAPLSRVENGDSDVLAV